MPYNLQVGIQIEIAIIMERVTLGVSLQLNPYPYPSDSPPSGVVYSKGTSQTNEGLHLTLHTIPGYVHGEVYRYETDP